MPAEAPVANAESKALSTRLEALEARTTQLQAELAATKAQADAATAEPVEAAPVENDGLGWSWDAYVQAQYESSHSGTICIRAAR